MTTFARVDGGHGMGDSDSKVLGLGLGDSVAPFVITVYWPSGIVEVYDDLVAGTFVVLTEGEGTGTAGSVTAPVGGGLTLGIHPVPATGTCFLELDFPDVGNGPIRVLIVDLYGRIVRQEDVEPSGERGTLAVTGLTPGVYSVTASRGLWSARARMVIVR